ncbi:hypothetical protein WMF27_45010 [Sorangium sp. So ce281]|uniref:hypothetical protein n=1 Tax=unclassified Sorangium TaxID=2621164 RepID=UPI003F5F171D
MHSDRNLAAARLLAGSLLLVIGCNARAPAEGTGAARSGAEPHAPRRSASSSPRPDPPPAASPSSAAPSAAPAPSAVDRAPFRPVPFEAIQSAKHDIIEDHAVRVDLRPYCEPEAQEPGSTSPSGPMAWPGLRLDDYTPLHELLSKNPSFIGVVPERKRRLIVVVFEPDFRDWASVQREIPAPRRVPVELRPGCHTRQQRELAKQVLETLAKEPGAGKAVHAWAPDASIAGYRVFVLPGDEATAAFVAERLGSIANVWFSRPFGHH